MRILFWFFIFANIALLGIQTLTPDSSGVEVREPERLANQFLEDHIRLLTLEEVSRVLAETRGEVLPDTNFASPNVSPLSRVERDPLALPAEMEQADGVPAVADAVPATAASPVTAPPETAPVAAAPAAVPPAPVATPPAVDVPAPADRSRSPVIPGYASCVEVGEFNKAEATLFEMQLLVLSLNPDNIAVAPVMEGARFMVHVPPLADQSAADAKVAELQRQGVKNLFVIREQSALRWAISLGVFSTREAATRFVEDLGKTGVSGLQITPRGTASERLLYRISNLTDEQMIFVEGVVAKFPRQAMRQCQPIS